MGAAGVAVGVAAVGMYQSYRANQRAKEGARDLAEFNRKAAEADIRAARLELAQKQSLTRTQRALDEGRITVAAAKSGVAITGSVLDALEMNAMELATEENNLRVEFESVRQRLRMEARLATAAGRMRVREANDQMTGDFLSGTAQIVGAVSSAQSSGGS